MGSEVKVLVSGANGFIGSNLCERLLSEGFRVRAMILPGTPEWYLNGIDVEKVYADVTRPETLHSALKGVELVYHLAARATDWGAWDTFIKVNAIGSKNMALASAKAGVKRFVQMSSIAVHKYKNITNGDEELERDCKKLAYGVSKIMAEDYVKEVSGETGMEFAIVRPGVFPFGPRDTTSFYHIARAMEQGAFGYINRGRAKISISYVENLTYGLFLVGTKKEAKNQVFIIEDGIAISWKELIEKFATALGLPPPFLSLPRALAYGIAGMMEGIFKLFGIEKAPPLTRYRINVSSFDLIFSSEKARRVLGYEPRIGLEEGIARTVEWYRKFKSSGIKI